MRGAGHVAGFMAPADILRMKDWTILRIRGARGLPALDAIQFLGCVQAIRPLLADARWHFRWTPVQRNTEFDGLRIEVPFGSALQREISTAFESRIPPPDTVVAEPLRTEIDLDTVQDEGELNGCLGLLWRFSEFVSDLRTRNPGLQARQIQGLAPGALLTFVTGDRRHLERALEMAGVGTLPAVPFSRFLSELSANPLTYRIPPGSRAEAVDTARVHHLAGCTFASDFYPIAKSS